MLRDRAGRWVARECQTTHFSRSLTDTTTGSGFYSFHDRYRQPTAPFLGPDGRAREQAKGHTHSWPWRASTFVCPAETVSDSSGTTASTRACRNQNQRLRFHFRLDRVDEKKRDAWVSTDLLWTPPRHSTRFGASSTISGVHCTALADDCSRTAPGFRIRDSVPTAAEGDSLALNVRRFWTMWHCDRCDHVHQSIPFPLAQPHPPRSSQW